MSTQETRAGSLLPSRWVLTRDIASFVLGWGAALWEMSRTDLRPEVLVFCAGVVGVPALLNGAQTVASAVAGRSSTGPPSEQSPPAPQSP